MLDLKKLHKYANTIKSQQSGLGRDLQAYVVGVTFDGRQERIKRLAEGKARFTPVKIERERTNPHDFYAVRVVAEIEDGSWEQVGYLPRQMAKLVCSSLDNGINIDAKITRIKGGFYAEDKQEELSWGLEVRLFPEQ